MTRLGFLIGVPALALIVAGCSATADPPEATTSASPDTAPVAPHRFAKPVPPVVPQSERAPVTPIAGERPALTAAAEAVKPPESVPAEYVHTPGGWIHPSCVHALPEGATIDEQDNVTVEGKLVAHYAPCAYEAFKGHAAVKLAPKEADGPGVSGPTYSGWVEDDQQNAPTNSWSNSALWNYVVAEIQTPPAPPANGGTLYYFAGLESSQAGCGFIIQPVLQWGVGPNGQGNYWSVADWVWSNGANSYYTASFYPAVGETLQTDMWISADNNGQQTYQIFAEDIQNTSKWNETSLTTSCKMNAAFPAVFEVDRGYPISTCSQVPYNYVNFPWIQLYIPNGNWNGYAIQPYAPSKNFPIGSGTPSTCGWAIGNNATMTTLWM